MSDDLIPVDNGIDGQGIESHRAWLALPEPEKEQWRARAKVAIADGKQANGYA